MNYWISPSFEYVDMNKENKINSLINYVCNVKDLSFEDITSKKRHRHLAETRQKLFYIMHRVFNIPCTDVGKIFNRDHSTVLYGCKLIGGFIEIDPAFEKEMSDIINKFRYKPSTTDIHRIDKSIYKK